MSPGAQKKPPSSGLFWQNSRSTAEDPQFTMRRNREEPQIVTFEKPEPADAWHSVTPTITSEQDPAASWQSVGV